ncbi:glycine betaine ABC transporter substrate-binding protein [Cognatishimia sp. SS12]|uniref:ABC transporter substrate-binding protein n=1 Tax=Cognatishimia sp. SS12 TaxID=2979465 RepID=UPI00232D31D6|nr:glycine betaine ABC transporter substrate-binding protein [Cognatishimia sp. SS12]MDC0738901.1 glycine betaine ABC transporter substrate-binding protein [Cognatishimia sp. SS12]
MKLMKSTVLSAAIVCAAAGVQAQEKVMIGEPSWAGAKIMANLIGQVIESRLGGEVGYAPGANAVIFEAMNGGRGDIDVHPDVWLPNQSSFTDKFVDGAGTVALSEGSYKGQAGFCVPNYMVEKHNIKSVFDLATPEGQALFDGDNDGMGEIWVGASGWASTNIHRVKVRDYGIQSFLEPSTEDEAVFYARLKDAIAEEQGVVFYCYKPHYVHALYPVTLLDEPEYDADQYNIVTADSDADWFEKSKITTGDEVKTVRVAHSKSLETRNPAAASFLSAIDMSSDALSQLTYEVVVQGEAIEDVVATWIENNGETVDGWLGLN